MAATRIVTTRSQDLQALVTSGQSTLDAWSALSALLTSRLSADHAALLAEPVANPSRGETDWYGQGDGPAVPLTSLPPDQRQAVRATLDRQIGDIRALAERFVTSRVESDRLFGELLTLAMRIPNEGSIYVLGGRPILVAWGHAPSGPDGQAVDLWVRHLAPPQPMAILPPPPPALLGPVLGHIARWPLALFGAGLLLLLLALLILTRDPLGWFDVVAPVCQVSPQDTALLAELREREARGGVLRSMLAGLTNDAGRRRQMCPPVQPPAPPPSDDKRLATERGAHEGKLQIILAWGDKSDLDLHVACPSGEEIKFDHKAACGGVLDVDANAFTASSVSDPVENVSFANPQPGRYRVVVLAYKLRTDGATQIPFRVRIIREGQPEQVVTGTAREGQVQTVTQIEIPAP